MTRCLIVSRIVIWVAGVLLLSTTLAAQSTEWEVPRMADGRPDLQGIWTNATLTPVERPDSSPDSAVLTAEEAARRKQDAIDRDIRLWNAAPKKAEAGKNVGAYNNFWMDRGTTVVGTRRTSLVVHPPNGKIPWSPAGRERYEIDLTKYGVGPFDSWDDTDTGERCLTDGLPFVPLQGYNMNYHILQSPGWVAILTEMFHEYRLIPTDARTHVSSLIGQWMGDARGRWEGDMLVVETTNFADKTHYLWRATWRGARPGLHLVERFTRVDEETIEYEFTMTDPDMFTQSWTAVVPMTTNHASRGVTTGPMYEYACHEGNYGLLNILRGARMQKNPN